MKINYNGTQVPVTHAEDIYPGQCFAYESWYYMRVELTGVGLEEMELEAAREDSIVAANLNGGTCRLLRNKTIVKPLTSKCTLRDRVVHDHEGKADEF